PAKLDPRYYFQMVEFLQSVPQVTPPSTHLRRSLVNKDHGLQDRIFLRKTQDNLLERKMLQHACYQTGEFFVLLAQFQHLILYQPISSNSTLRLYRLTGSPTLQTVHVQPTLAECCSSQLGRSCSQMAVRTYKCTRLMECLGCVGGI